MAMSISFHIVIYTRSGILKFMLPYFPILLYLEKYNENNGAFGTWNPLAIFILCSSSDGINIYFCEELQLVLHTLFRGVFEKVWNSGELLRTSHVNQKVR